MLFWDRPTLKTRAKAVLKTSYGTSLLVCLLYSVMISGVSFVNMISNITEQGIFDRFFERGGFFSLYSGLLFSGAVISLLLGLFVYNLFEIGVARYFTVCRYNSVKFNEMMYGFKGGYYASNVKTMFLRQLYVFLWSLLFVIPGIIKSYSYWMVPYILAENPNLPAERVLEISSRTMEGEKWETFVLHLSFIGWYILAAFTLGIGYVLLAPYVQATNAELYGALRAKAVKTGICTRQELGADVA